MLEFLLCSMLTLLPDYLYRRYVQDKRIGREITLFSMWYELRWGIVTCFMLTVTLITVIFFFHPSSTSVTGYFRTITILPETGGRVTEVLVTDNQVVQAGDPLFRMDDSIQQANVEAARRQVTEIDAAQIVAQSELAAAIGTLEQATGAVRQAQEELDTKLELQQRNANVVTQREIDRLQIAVDGREGAQHAALAQKEAVDAKIETLLPAQKASAEAALAQAEVLQSKMVVYAGITGTVQQLALQPGDYVSPILRPAGILIPQTTDDRRFQAGFGQLSAQIIHPGMIGEMTCASLPFTIIPMVVTKKQGTIAAGQFRPTDQLIDVATPTAPGSVTVTMIPLYEGQANAIPPGSACAANVYTSNHDRLETEDLPFLTRISLHAVDTVGIAHAALLRVQALLMPVKTLVFSGGH
ncbi:HlyD family secretion protein [Pseudoruegeria sp. SK021]|uniref:HlyD family secretion protein n=1 Tax=Pseudoruegeria sp. SK021 TaxID=1933035 RepID=UPI000A2324B6|nr:biotin/lipoyl-binding protein [Pseudoruegeria sp. SK021]OSP56692.1 secretion protein HlyD [Pseudoruegeria sp. SK021]